MIWFESPAEREAYPIINTIAIKHKLKFYYQKQFGYQSGGYSSMKEYCKARGKPYYENYNGYRKAWNSTSWESEIYRMDFVLESDKAKLAIEIDGEQFHLDVEHDTIRDRTLMRYGYVVLRIPARTVFHDKMAFKEAIKEEIENVFTDIRSRPWRKEL